MEFSVQIDGKLLTELSFSKKYKFKWIFTNKIKSGTKLSTEAKFKDSLNYFIL